MGLRERNAAQTRELILHTALDLFVAQGFEPTRMEEIADQADIGVSTLYRYFPTKEQLLTEPLALHGQMAEAVRARPATESLELALGHALTALLLTPRPDTSRLEQLLAVIETAPGARARLLEQADQEQLLLTRAIAERLGRPEDAYCQMTARQTMSILAQIGLRRPGEHAQDNATMVQETLTYLRGLLDQLRTEPPALPRIDD